MQTVTGAMVRTAILAKAEKESQETKEAIKNKAKTFFDLQREKQALDPDNAHHATAVKIGKLDAKKFLDAVKDPAHAGHDQAIRSLKNDYDMDFSKAEADFVNRACNDMDSHPYEKQDPSYENAVYEQYRPKENAGIEELTMHNNFKTAVKNAWNRSGYRANKDTIDALAGKYGLKRNMNMVLGNDLGSDFSKAANSDLIQGLRNEVRNKKK